MAAVTTGVESRVALLVALSAEEVLALTGALDARGLSVKTLASGAAAIPVLETTSVEVVLVKADIGDLDDVIAACGDIPVIAVVTAGDERAATLALRAGAVATVPVPWVAEDLRLPLDRALETPPSRNQEPPPARIRRDGLLGDSEPMRRVADLIGRAAPVMATALVRGETGTGKELVARALHLRSARKDGPFVKVHCAALPDALLESELFGYEKGAFTGATARKPGRIELAEGGTLFLDEIGDITPALQVKLLRLLQDREYERLGGVQTIKADVRFVAATHRDLENMVKRGEFREDLFYRLNVVTLWLPPLRARRDDIPELARAFATEFCCAYGKPGATLDATAIDALRSERWPGNVRQLQNFVERLIVLAQGPITSDDVRREMGEHVRFETQITGVAAGGSSNPTPDPVSSSVARPLGEAVRIAERHAIERALRHSGGNRTVAARILGVSRATLYTKLEEHGIS